MLRSLATVFEASRQWYVNAMRKKLKDENKVKIS